MTSPQPSPTEFAAYVGIDWANQKHTCSLRAADSQRIENYELDNTPEAVEKWAAELEQRFQGRPIAVALEQQRGALVALLSQYAHLVLHPVHPSTLDHYRKGFHPSGAKSDPAASDLLRDLLERHRDRLKPLKPDTEATRKLQFLVEGRRKLVDEKTGLSNRLTDTLKQIFPQVLRWFDDVASPLVGDLLRRWPTLPDLQKAKPATVRDFLHQHNCRSEERTEQRLQAIQQAVPATRDGALLQAGSLAVESLVRLIAGLRDSIGRYDKVIAEITKAHPDFPIFDSLPGAGAALAPRLIAAFGTDRDRFGNAADLQCFTGIAPVVQSSGSQRWTHWRWACPKFIRQSVQEWAQHSIPRSVWAGEYYQQQRDGGSSHHAAVRALAFKWLRILYRCWKDRKPYDEQIYLRSREKRLLPLPPTPATT